MTDTKSLTIGLVPEGPIAYDGHSFRYSKGERKYIDDLAKKFKKVIIFSFVYRPGHVYYDACSHSVFKADNIEFVELPAQKKDAPSVFDKVVQFAKVFSMLFREVKKVDYLYLFLPGYPSAMAWMSGKVRGKKHFVYAADDWIQATPGMFKWESLVLYISPQYKMFYNDFS